MHIITGLGVGGTEKMLSKLVGASDRARFRHIVVSMMQHGSLGGEIESNGVSVFGLDMKRSRSRLRRVLHFRGLIRRYSPDVLQTWLYHADLLGIAGLAVKKVPLVWNIRSSVHPGLETWIVRLCARLSSVPAAVVVNSEAGRSVHSALGYHPRRWEFIPNGFDLEKFRPSQEARKSLRDELGLADDTVLIGRIARFDPIKDFATLFAAAGRLAQTERNVHFVLAGDGVTVDNKSLSVLITQEGLEGRVHLLGHQTDIASLTAALDIATSSSAREGFPSVVGEAMACGVPCVVTDVGDSAAIVGDCGTVVPRKDPAALAMGWRTLLEMGAEGRRILGEAARKSISGKYSLQQVVRQYENLYESLSGAETPPP